MVTTWILCPSAQDHSPGSSLTEYLRVYNLPRCHLSFIISYWVIFKYSSLRIDQILEADFSCLYLPLFLCSPVICAFWHMYSFYPFLISSWFTPSSLPLPCQLAPSPKSCLWLPRCMSFVTFTSSYVGKMSVIFHSGLTVLPWKMGHFCLYRQQF
jgi:hypothetical protein